MSPKQGDQHILLHQHWPLPQCCLCNHEAEIARLRAQLDKAEAVVREAEKIWGVIPITGPGTLGPDVAVPLLAYEVLRMALAAYRERA